MTQTLLFGQFNPIVSARKSELLKVQKLRTQGPQHFKAPSAYQVHVALLLISTFAILTAVCVQLDLVKDPCSSVASDQPWSLD